MKEINTAHPLEEQCTEMAAILGLEEPVTAQVLLSALANPVYAHNLLVCRNAPEFMQQLLKNPPAIIAEDGVVPSTATLISNAAKSFARWAATGFSTVSNETYERRLNACDACPDLNVPPPKQGALYKMMGAKVDERKVCRKCGCVVSVKARRNTDTCPEPDPQNPGFNRWQEPIPG